MGEVHQTEVDGVPALWADVAGPLRAALMVRVGHADETMVTSGISHLVEHLALFGLGRPGDHSNGYVDQTTTVYHCVGDADSTVEFMSSVTRQLAELPLNRLEAERPILRAERARRSTGAEDRLNVWRYGAQGYGLAGQGELGLERLAGPELQRWSSRYATAGNAVLWLSAPPPPGLRLHLPEGDPMPAPDPRPSILGDLPAWFPGPVDGIALSAVLERGYPNHVLAAVLRSRLVDVLRTQRAVAYSPQTDYRPLTGRVGRLLVMSDLVAGRQSDGVRPFLAALGELAEVGVPDAELGTGSRSGGGVTEADLTAWRSDRAREDSEPYAPLGRLMGQAWQLLHGEPLIGPEEMAEQIAAMRPADVAVAAQRALASAVAQVPSGVRVSRAPWVQAPATLIEPLDGATHERLGDRAGTEQLVLAERGITLRGTNSPSFTVPMDQTVAVQHWDDGRRVLVGADANRIIVEPTLWARGAELVQQIDERWPAALRVDMGERPLDEIPQPVTSPAAVAAKEAEAAAAAQAAHQARGMRIGLWLSGIMTAVFVVMAIAYRLPFALLPAALCAYSMYDVQRKRKRLLATGSAARR